MRYSACARELTSLQAPEIQTMYNIPLPISALRTRVRQEFEQNRFVAKLPVVDVLLFKSHAEYQVRTKWHRNRGATPVPAGTDADCAAIGDDELLEADDARHVLLQGGELQGRSQTAIELYAGVPGGRLTTQ